MLTKCTRGVGGLCAAAPVAAEQGGGGWPLHMWGRGNKKREHGGPAGLAGIIIFGNSWLRFLSSAWLVT
jgi:hypothetical protein